MEYVLLGGMTLLIACGVVALALERPAQICECATATPKNGPVARRTGKTRRPRCGQAAAAPSAQRHAAFGPGATLLPATAPDRHGAIPVDSCGDVAADNAAPYSPQELRTLLEQRPPTPPRIT